MIQTQLAIDPSETGKGSKGGLPVCQACNASRREDATGESRQGSLEVQECHHSKGRYESDRAWSGNYVWRCVIRTNNAEVVCWSMDVT